MSGSRDQQWRSGDISRSLSTEFQHSQEKNKHRWVRPGFTPAARCVVKVAVYEDNDAAENVKISFIHSNFKSSNILTKTIFDHVITSGMNQGFIDKVELEVNPYRQEGDTDETSLINYSISFNPDCSEENRKAMCDVIQHELKVLGRKYTRYTDSKLSETDLNKIEVKLIAAPIDFNALRKAQYERYELTQAAVRHLAPIRDKMNGKSKQNIQARKTYWKVQTFFLARILNKIREKNKEHLNPITTEKLYNLRLQIM